MEINPIYAAKPKRRPTVFNVKCNVKSHVRINLGISPLHLRTIHKDFIMLVEVMLIHHTEFKKY